MRERKLPALLPVARPVFWGEEAEYITEALAQGELSGKGAFVAQFERAFAEATERPYAIAVNSGTSALHLALNCLDIRCGDEVIVPAFTMIAPVLAILYCGAIPVPVDIDDTWNIDARQIEAKITARTRAILVVHNYGHPADMDAISALAERHRLRLVEDCAEGLGATVRGRQVGTYGDFSCFSLYANKTITTGEGGFLTTNDPNLAKLARWKRELCFGQDEETRYIHRAVGYSYRLGNLQAALGLAQLKYLKEAVDAKIEVATRYDKVLRGIDGIILPSEASWARHVYWVYGIRIEVPFRFSLDKLQRSLLREGIETRRFFTPVHCQPVVPKQGCHGSFPIAEHVAATGLCLPAFIGITDSNIAHVAEAIKGYLYSPDCEQDTDVST